MPTSIPTKLHSLQMLSHDSCTFGQNENHRHQEIELKAANCSTTSGRELSTTQRERKRANDREAQRAIREGTRNRISSLESKILELRRTHEANDNEVLVLQQRNEALEKMNADLRKRLATVSGGSASPR